MADSPTRPTRLKFDNKAAFRTLCGINHSNLELLEEKLNLQMEAPGGEITLFGEEANIVKGELVLRRLYERAVRHEVVGRTEVHSELSFVLDQVRPSEGDILSFAAGRRRITPRNPAQQAYLRALKNPEFDLVFGAGPAGTGKTFLAIAYGASELLAKRVDRLVVARPALEAGERLGFLPGDLEEKVDPYMMPIWDSLNQTLGPEKMKRLREQGKIEIAPLAFMRGRTLSDCFVVLDEAQNATIAQMQMVLTRLGEGGRMVVTGDPDQSDLPGKTPSGLAHALGILSGVKGIKIHNFSAADVVRHPLVARIVRAYAANATPS